MPQSVRCSYTVEGNGPALVLIHGVGGRAQAWARVVDFLKPNFTCFAYDLRGHGASPKSALPITLDDLVADVEALREEIGIEKINVFGNSLGGMVAPAYARAYPNRTASVGLISTAAFRTPEDSARVRAVADAIRKEGVEKLVDGFVSRWFTEDFLKDSPEIVQARKQQVLGTDPAVFADVFRLYAETEMSPWIHEVSVPGLVLTGENDVNCSPRLNKEIAAALRGSKLVVVDHAKHGLVIESPRRVADEITSFLTSLPSA